MSAFGAKETVGRRGRNVRFGRKVDIDQAGIDGVWSQSYGAAMDDEVHIEVLEFGATVPPGGHLIPFPRKADGTPDLAKGMAGPAEILEAEEQGHRWIFLECPPHA